MVSMLNLASFSRSGKALFVQLAAISVRRSTSADCLVELHSATGGVRWSGRSGTPVRRTRPGRREIMRRASREDMGVIPGVFGGRWVTGEALFVGVPPGPEMDACMTWPPCLIRSVAPGDRVEVCLGHEVVDDYLEFLAARCRPNTVLAAGFCRASDFARQVPSFFTQHFEGW